MPKVNFTYALKRFFPELKETSIPAKSVHELLEVLDNAHPGLSNYIVDDQKALRKHVKIFLNGKEIKDRINLTDKLFDESDVYIMQALSGG